MCTILIIVCGYYQYRHPPAHKILPHEILKVMYRFHILYKLFPNLLQDNAFDALFKPVCVFMRDKSACTDHHICLFDVCLCVNVSCMGVNMIVR